MAKHRIAILVGSLRRDSINRKVANSICMLTSDMLSCHVVEVGKLPLFNQDEEAHPTKEVSEFRRQISDSDGVLFCSPEYNRGIPGVLKNAIDVGSRPYGKSVWDKKPGAIVTAVTRRDRRLRFQPPAAPGLRVPQHADDAAAGSLSGPCHGREFRRTRAVARRTFQGPGGECRVVLCRLGRPDRPRPAPAGGGCGPHGPEGIKNARRGCRRAFRLR